MAIDADVVVIGGGIAGVFAAISAAERSTVRLIAASQSTLRQASGLIDVLGYAPRSGEGPLADPYSALGALPADHPYRCVGEDGLREGILLFDALLGNAYEGAHTERNALVPTVDGSVKPTARYPSSVAAGLASRPRNTLLVGFESIPDFDAPLAAAHLDALGAPWRVRGVTVQFPGDWRADTVLSRYARALDRDEPLETGIDGAHAPTGARTRAALADCVRPQLDGETRVGFPAILGLENPDVVRRDLEERLGVRVFEVPMGPPSLPGIRLENRLYDAMDDAGVRVTTGVRVVEYDGGSTLVESVMVDREGQRIPYTADQFVLATGGLVGTGIQTTRTRVREPIFDCYVPHPDDRYEWFENEAFGDHAFARFGVTVDESLRPRSADGSPEFENLRAAGSVIGGYDFAAEKSGAGVSIATGYVAGSRAGGAVS